ncbi:predicted protein [Paecilomyces variotii No. 5]|uniref:Protein kinase domain-containing protein n=1 Tax=Byssochlamys spectabilis (strain No. 5 / NBRC 109023) TaxID=1356009 RepID=V5G2D8_BYSSN|nr:predicted protein [Paecilomyces variotii No. 5]
MAADDDWEDLGFRRSHFCIDDPPDDFVFQFRGSEEGWKLGPILKERVLHGDEYEGVQISEASGVCIATQIMGPKKGTKAIAKIRQQIPPDMDDPSELRRNVDYSVYKSTAPSIWAAREFDLLGFLTEKGSKCTPRYLGHRTLFQNADDHVPGGYFVVTLMEKLPGTNLWDWPDFDLEMRNRVRIAFGKAIREFYSYGLDHHDPRRNNLIWDEKSDRCWIIDLEDGDKIDPPRKFVPRRDWLAWGIIAASDFQGPIDPMTPDDYDECPDDETLYALATRTKTRQFSEKLW